jgi:hypothetical protein
LEVGLCFQRLPKSLSSLQVDENLKRLGGEKVIASMCGGVCTDLKKLKVGSSLLLVCPAALEK